MLLGSKLACELLGRERSERIKGQAPLLQESHGLIGQSVIDLQLLLDAPEAHAPPLFASDAWQRISPATVLGGWAQFQSIVVCHVSRSIRCMGIADRPGFIETEPRYFAAIAECCAPFGLGSGVFHIRGEEAAEIASSFKELSDLSTQHASDFECRSTEIHHHPVHQRSCIVGTGAVRSLYVLYPWQGERILCRGSVMSYHEHFVPAPMTNEEWSAALGGADAIPLPSWQAPFYTSNGQQDPDDSRALDMG